MLLKLFMNASPTLFRGGRLFDGRQFLSSTDLRTDSEGTISEIGSGLSASPEETTVDLNGRWLLPGLVDCHVHFREPGLVRKEGYLTGSSGALHGGVTTVLEIQNNPPMMETAELLRQKSADLKGISRVDYAPYGSLTKRSIPHLKEMAPFMPAVKCFFGGSTGSSGVHSDHELRELFKAAAEAGVKIVAHCEDDQIMADARAHATPETADRHDLMRPERGEIESIRTAIRIAQEVGASLHVFHISTSIGGQLVAEAHEAGMAVTGTTGAQYLLVTAEQAHAAKQNRFKINPSIKDDANRQGLRRLVAEGRLQGIGTDHAPHPLEDKDRPYGKAPSGFPSIDLLLPLIFAVADESDIELEVALNAVTRMPADEFGLLRKGRLVIGADADLVALDPKVGKLVDESTLPSKSKWSPFHGQRLRGFPEQVWLRGTLVFNQGFFPIKPSGKPLLAP
jgi:dihydroorotase